MYRPTSTTVPWVLDVIYYSTHGTGQPEVEIDSDPGTRKATTPRGAGKLLNKDLGPGPKSNSPIGGLKNDWENEWQLQTPHSCNEKRPEGAHLLGLTGSCCAYGGQRDP